MSTWWESEADAVPPCLGDIDCDEDLLSAVVAAAVKESCIRQRVLQPLLREICFQEALGVVERAIQLRDEDAKVISCAQRRHVLQCADLLQTGIQYLVFRTAA